MIKFRWFLQLCSLLLFASFSFTLKAQMLPPNPTPRSDPKTPLTCAQVPGTSLNCKYDLSCTQNVLAVDTPKPVSAPNTPMSSISTELKTSTYTCQVKCEVSIDSYPGGRSQDPSCPAGSKVGSMTENCPIRPGGYPEKTVPVEPQTVNASDPASAKVVCESNAKLYCKSKCADYPKSITKEYAPICFTTNCPSK